jgi:hypothetical protein
MTMSLLYGLDPMITRNYNYVMMSIGSNSCFVTGALCLNGGNSYDFANSVGHPMSNSVRLLIYNGIRTISGRLVLYYRSLGTASELCLVNYLK